MRAGLTFLIALTGCESWQTPVDGDACELAQRNELCPECSGDHYTCAIDGVRAGGPACQGCGAETYLYTELCDRGIEHVEGTVRCHEGR